ncbi:hypothetical protein HK099_000274 [Clydaea vesicula]|uniref:Bulb-type lectin domain-containing protein n=1 Tax=Clydaea vesicula TaxID=447962 RepID=A0AAD5XWL6_9FUNG|nr:hypothetical protein HK099_000274 [Clydaea vesicula]KAJ3389506.1 hypothetical protein HDU92_001003 [Lobulomyces angularis]
MKFTIVTLATLLASTLASPVNDKFPVASAVETNYEQELPENFTKPDANTPTTPSDVKSVEEINNKASSLRAAAHPCGTSVGSNFKNGNYISSGQCLYSQNGHSAVMQPDGNFVIYCSNLVAKWATGTQSVGADTFILQGDGNLVVYAGGYNGLARWASNTYSNGGDILFMQNDGNLVLYNGGRAVWASNTYC